MSMTSAAASSSSTASQFTYPGTTFFPTPFHLQQTQSYVAAPAPLPPVQLPAPPPVVPKLPTVYSLPQYQQIEHKAETKKKALPLKAAGQSWEDPSLADWPENDYRLFCGDLGNEVNDDGLSEAFSRFPSFNMARVVRDKRTGKTKGYGFVSFANPLDLAAALKEMNGKYVGNRPIKLRKSNWRERTDFNALERQKNNSQKKPKLSKKSILHK